MELKILSLNVFLRPPLVQEPMGDYKNERLELILRDVVPLFDVLGLQEMFGWSLRIKKLLKKSKKLGFHSKLGCSTSIFKGKLVDSGLVTLTKWPIITHERMMFRNCADVDRIASKGVLYTMLESTHVVHFFHTHMQASYPSAPCFISKTPCLESDVKLRLLQLDEMIEFIESCLENKPKGAVILAGDFNCNYDDEYELVFQKLSNKFNVELLTDLEPTYVDWSYLTTKKEKTPKREKLDYIFSLGEKNFQVKLKETLNFKVNNKRFDQLSDHSGVAVTLLFE